MKEQFEEYYRKRKDKGHLYNDWEPKRLEIAANAVQENNCESVLDIGCGEGTLSRLLGDQRLYGIDISETALEMAEKNYTETAQANLEDENVLRHFDTEFDAVVCLEVLQHLFRPDEFLNNLVRNLSPGVLIILSVPNFVFWKHRLDVLRGNIPSEYTLYTTSEHISHFTVGRFKNLIIESGLNLHQIHYDSSYPVLPDQITQFIPLNLVPGFTARQMVAIATVKE